MGVTPIQVAYPSVDDPHLRIALGACRFTARPGEGEEWVAGTYTDPTDRRPLRIVEEEAGVTITEAEPSFERIPAVFGGVPRYEVELGKMRPFSLTIETGASDFDLDLGGIPLSRLMVRQGAGKLEFGFPVANPEPMELLDEIERILKISCAPVTWPIGMGRDLLGIYHLVEDRIFKPSKELRAMVATTDTVPGAGAPETDTASEPSAA